MKYDVLIAGMIRTEHGRFWDEIARRFEAAGKTVAFMPAMDEAAVPLAHRGEHVFCVPEEIRKRSLPRATEPEIEEIERTYGLTSLRLLTMHEMYSTERYDEDRLLQKTVNFFRVCREWFDSNEADVVVEETGGWIECQVIFRIARQRGIPHLFIEPGPLTNTIVFARNAMNVSFPKGPGLSELPEEGRRAVEAYVERVTADPKLLVPQKDRWYYKDATVFNLINPNTFAKVMRILHRKAFVNRFEETFSTRILAVRYLKSVIRRKLVAPYYTRLAPEPSPFIYFPLHQPYDMQILVRAPHCFRQEAVVEMISRSLPQGVHLYIKEHPVSIGWYPFPILRGMARLPHVKLIHPGTSSHDLIRAARAIITINSKVGFESITYGKPVVTLGASFYRGFGATFDVHDLADLAPVIRRALDEPADREAIGGLLHAVIEQSNPGDIYGMDEENLARFFSALADEVERATGS